MKSILLTDELFSLPNKAGWPIGATAFSHVEGVYWPVYGTQGGYEIRIEDWDRDEAWEEACRQVESLRLIERMRDRPGYRNAAAKALRSSTWYRQTLR